MHGELEEMQWLGSGSEAESYMSNVEEAFVVCLIRRRCL